MKAPTSPERIRILIAHSYYAARGGEDSIFETETDTLRRAGHHVVTYAVRTEHASLRGVRDAVSRGARALWSHGTARAIADVITRERPAVAHFHNIFPNLSVAAFAACRRSGVPVVWSLHNYRLVCAAGTFFRNNAPCQLCSRWGPLPAVTYGCYHESRLQSGWVGGTHWLLRKTGVFRSWVTRFIATSEFSRGLYVKAGLPGHQVALKPNHLGVDPSPSARLGNSFLYAGRLDPAKGLDVVIRALSTVPAAELLVAGVGPHEPVLRELAAPLGGRVKFLGQLSTAQLYRQLSQVRALVLPTRWFEACPISVLEALGHGVPVIASNIGSMPEFVQDGINGRLAPPGDIASWRDVLSEVFANTAHAEMLGRGARRSFEERFSPAAGVQALEGIYADVIQERSSPNR